MKTTEAAGREDAIAEEIKTTMVGEETLKDTFA